MSSIRYHKRMSSKERVRCGHARPLRRILVIMILLSRHHACGWIVNERLVRSRSFMSRRSEETSMPTARPSSRTASALASGSTDHHHTNFNADATRSLLRGILHRSQQTMRQKAMYEREYCTANTTDVSSQRSLVIDFLQVMEHNVDQATTSNELLHNHDTINSQNQSMACMEIHDADTEATRSGFRGNAIPTTSPTDVVTSYGRHPGVTTTALAHSLWAYVIRPGKDSVIDATAGNGADSLVLAKLLFPAIPAAEVPSTDTITTNSSLICIDIQEMACMRTRQTLESYLPAHIMQNNIHICHGSHTPLPMDIIHPPHGRSNTSVALVVYNLGFLPGTAGTISRLIQTTTSTSIASIADAAQILRIGGMLSIMTYPRTNPTEDRVIRTFAEGLALFSSRTHDWRMVEVPPAKNTNRDPNAYDQPLEDVVDDDREERWSELVHSKLQSVWDRLGPDQTWRVHEYKKLGWVDAPILITAVRIK